MKYFPLVWAAIWRKPARTVLMFLSVTIAFLLFGMTIGLNASARSLVKNSREDRIYVSSRFGEPIPVSELKLISRMPHVRVAGGMTYLAGYFGDPKNIVSLYMVDKQLTQVWDELGITPARFGQFAATHSGLFVSRNMARRLKIKVGDSFPIIPRPPAPRREDGKRVWPFMVLSIIDDVPNGPPGGYGIGSYDYFDQSRAANSRGTVDQIELLASNIAGADSLAQFIDNSFKNAPIATQSLTERVVAQATTESGVDVLKVTEAIAASGLFMILFLTTNTIAQSVRERIPEFAAMKALGFSDTGVMLLVFAEASIPCLFGAAFGIGLASIYTTSLLNLLPPNAALSILPSFNVGVLLLAFVTAVAVVIASAAIPALRIKRLSVAEALSGR